MAVAAGLLGLGLAGAAGGQIGAGALANKGGVGFGDTIQAFNDPQLNVALQAFTQDALGSIGRFDAVQAPNQFEELVGRIQALPIDEKNKRRALTTLFQIQKGMSPEELRSPGRLANVLERLGVALNEAAPGQDDDLARIFEEVKRAETNQRALEESGAIEQNRQIVFDRLRTASAAAQQGQAAAQFAETGTPQNAFQQALFDQQQRRDREFREAALGNANFGNLGVNQAFDSIRENEERSPLRLIEAALQASTGLSATLQPGQQAAGEASAQNVGAAQGAAQIAAQQGAALNSIQAQQRDPSALANGISAGTSALTSGFNTALLSGAFGGGGGAGPGAPVGGVSAAGRAPGTNPLGTNLTTGQSFFPVPNVFAR